MARHGLGLGNIRHHSVLLEEANEHVEGSLKTLRIPRSHHAVVGVKHSQTLPHGKSHPLMGNQFFLHHQCKPIPQHIVYNQIKEGGRDEVSLGCPSSILELGATLPVFTGNEL